MVSIITATYNHERFIGPCIESVLSQTYSHWEMIIIDDGSKDRTSEIVAQYRDSRIKHIKQDNVGIWRLGETYNKALGMSAGSLIAVLEGDDLWPPDKIEKQVPAFDRPEVVLSFGTVTMVDSNGKILYTQRGDLKWFKGRTRPQVLRRLFSNNFVPACTAMCRRDALVTIGGFYQPAGTPFVDYPTWLKLLLQGQVGPVPEVLGYWRVHQNQISFSKVFEMSEARSKVREDFYGQLSLETRNSLSISASDLTRLRQQSLSSYHFTVGRTELVNDEWREARTHFKEAFSRGTLLSKCLSSVGIICSYLRLNLEWAALIACRPRYNWMA